MAPENYLAIKDLSVDDRIFCRGISWYVTMITTLGVWLRNSISNTPWYLFNDEFDRQGFTRENIK